MKRLMRSVIGGILGILVLLVSSCGIGSINNITPTESATPLLTRIACVGDSITFGLGVPITENYPAQLQQKLGDKYTVLNFGASGATVNSGGDLPYVAQPVYQEAVDSAPTIVLIMLGTNDAKSPNNSPELEATFESDYRNLVQTFVKLPSHPKVYVLTPIGAILGDESLEATLATTLRPQIRQVGTELGLTVIDLESVLNGDPADYQDDGIHPTVAGYNLISTAVYNALEKE